MRPPALLMPSSNHFATGRSQGGAAWLTLGDRLLASRRKTTTDLSVVNIHRRLSRRDSRTSCSPSSKNPTSSPFVTHAVVITIREPDRMESLGRRGRTMKHYRSAGQIARARTADGHGVTGSEDGTMGTCSETRPSRSCQALNPGVVITTSVRSTPPA